MGVESPQERQERESRFRRWWDGLNADQRYYEVRAGHVRARLASPELKTKTPNQRKAERRRARGKA